jgi:hypothetical protein
VEVGAIIDLSQRGISACRGRGPGTTRDEPCAFARYNTASLLACSVPSVVLGWFTTGHYGGMWEGSVCAAHYAWAKEQPVVNRIRVLVDGITLRRESGGVWTWGE